MTTIESNIDSTEYIKAKKDINKLEEKYKDNLIVNNELARKLVSFQSNKASPIFRWFHFREGFSHDFIKYVLDTFNASQNHRLIDPMAGTGTAPFVASSYKKMESTAIELLPVGTFLMECRNMFSQLKVGELLQLAEETLNSRQQWININPSWEFKHLNITKGAFSEESEYELCKFKTWIEYLEKEEHKTFLDFVVFSILDKFSYARKDGQYLRWDYRAPRFANKTPRTKFNKGKIYSFFEALCEKLNYIIDDLKVQNDSPQEQLDRSSFVKVKQGSVFEKIEVLYDNAIDFVITSPPYCNRYDYTRTYALELAYLGIGEQKLKEMRQNLLTCTVENKAKQFSWIDTKLKHEIDDVFKSQKALEKILEFLNHEKNVGKLNNAGILSMVRGYFYDTTVHLAQISKKLKKGARYIMVNDNVRYNGLNIPVDLILSEIASSFGLETEKIWVLPSGKGNSSQQMKKHGRQELRKCVYIWRKA